MFFKGLVCEEPKTKIKIKIEMKIEMRIKMKTKTITEGKITLPVSDVEIVSKEMGTFYNPIMKFNRDLSILFLNALPEKITIADPMAATGIRSLRMMKECKNISHIFANDFDKIAIKEIITNAKRNKISCKLLKNIPEEKKIKKGMYLFNEDATLFLLKSKGFDYIDIDPFGSPNPFLDAAIKRVSRGGYIGVTATDTAALCGTYEQACKRKYDAKPLRNFMMHEVGLRILAKKVQTIGAQYDKAMTPVFSFSKDHYMRIFFRCEKGKEAVDTIIKEQGYILFCTNCLSMQKSSKNAGICCEKEMEYTGRLYLGNLWDKETIKNMQEKTKDKELLAFLKMISAEEETHSFKVYDLSKIAKKYKCSLRKLDQIIQELRNKKYAASRTHILDQGIRTDAPVEEIVKSLQK